MCENLLLPVDKTKYCFRVLHQHHHLVSLPGQIQQPVQIPAHLNGELILPLSCLLLLPIQMLRLSPPLQYIYP